MALPTDKPSFGVLDGVKVVYSAVEIAAPTAAAIMGEWGADVTWIENVWTGDSMRDTAWVKEMERRNMRSISMNPFTDEGKEALRAIVKDADIFIESGKGPMYARKGITDEFLWEINPKLVIVHVSGFGQYGDEEQINSAAYDLTVAAYAGIVTQNGSVDQPMNISPYLGDPHRGVVEAVATAASGLDRKPAEVALAWARDATGVSSTIVGARTPAQLQGVLSADDLELPVQIRHALDEVTSVQLGYPERF